MLRKELSVGVKVIETMMGVRSRHEIMVEGLEIEKIKEIGEGIEFVVSKQKEVRGIGESQVIKLYAIKGKEWRVGMEIQGKREKLEIQQGLLVEMHANARKIEETIEEYYDRRRQNKKRRRDDKRDEKQDEVMIFWSKFIKDKIREKSSE